RRKFYDVAQATGSPIAEEALRRIADLYAVEADVRGKAPAWRLAARRKMSAPRVENLRLWLESQLAQVPARSTLADAIRYTLTRWKGLTRFLDDG
ncbi:IS66 family transposase, partial [Hyphomonas chukchiensis]